MSVSLEARVAAAVTMLRLIRKQQAGAKEMGDMIDDVIRVLDESEPVPRPSLRVVPNGSVARDE